MRAPRLSALWGLLVGIAALVALPQEGTCRFAGITPEQVREVWAAREGKVKTARFEWTKREVIPKGSRSALMAGVVKDERIFPPVDTVLEGKCLLSIDAGKMRYEYDGSSWSSHKYRTAPLKHIMTYDGNEFKELISDSPIIDYPSAVVKKSAEGGGYRDRALRPLWLAARPIQSLDQGFPLLRYEATGRVVEVNGRKCNEFQMDDRTSKSIHRMLLDPERDHMLVRLVVTEDKGVVSLRLDVEYQADSVLGWVPKKWEYISRTRTDQTITSVSCQLTSFTANLVLPADEFDAAFPPRTKVNDFTGEKERAYVILPDGRKTEPVIREGKVVSYDELVTAGPEGRTRLLRIAMAVGAGVGIVLLAVWIRGRRRSKTPSPPGSLLPPI